MTNISGRSVRDELSAEGMLSSVQLDKLQMEEDLEMAALNSASGEQDP